MDTVFEWEGWLSLALITFMVLGLVADIAPAYLVMMGTVIVFLSLGILDLQDALSGFNDTSVLSIAILFVVGKGLELSGVLEFVLKLMFHAKERSLPVQLLQKDGNNIVWMLLKFILPVTMFSSFLANLPLVAMMILPTVEYSRMVNVSPSKLLLPLSYANLLGGTLTMIGTGTNLVVQSLATRKIPDLQMHIFEIGIVGVPVLVAGILYIIITSAKILPDRLAIQPPSINARQYNIVLVVKSISSLNRKTIERSGLKLMTGLKLVQIEREGNIIADISEDFVILAKDHLYFSGVIDAILSLTQLDGLTLLANESQVEVDLNRLEMNQCLVEAVIASESSMVKKKVSDLQFQSRYRAIVIAVHRHGAQLNRAIGEIELEAGDCLLMVADGPEFATKHRNNSTFALVSELPGFVPIQRQRAGIAAIFVLLMLIASGLGIEIFTAILFSAAGLLLSKCLSPKEAMDSIKLPFVIMIAAGFGISEAMVKSGAADLVAKPLLGIAGHSQLGLLIWAYIATTVFSLAMTNYAAIAIMFPIILSATQAEDLDFRPFAYTLMLAASAGLMTPTGCPTNLVVYGPGGYHFKDYILYGGPLQVLLLFVTIGVMVTLEWWWLWWTILILTTIAAVPVVANLKWNIIKDSSSQYSNNLVYDDEMEPVRLGDGISSSAFILTSSA